jgi:hypothetical protein
MTYLIQGWDVDVRLKSKFSSLPSANRRMETKNSKD